VQRIEIITNMTTAMLERLDQAYWRLATTLRGPNKLPLSERYSDKRSKQETGLTFFNLNALGNWI
jgi:hypothetical protein